MSTLADTKSALVTARIVDIGPFKGFYFDTRPPRLEAAVVFDISHMSQKLLFRMMELSWKHGFGCAAPQLAQSGEETQFVLSIGTTLPSSRSVRKYSVRLQRCLSEIHDFTESFLGQLDFSTLDISMFEGLSYGEFDPQFMAALRDQQYGGSWTAFRRDMIKRGRLEEAEVVDRCRKFEHANSKDMGLVGEKLSQELATLAESGRSEIN